MAQGILKSFYICNKHSESLQIVSEKIYVYGSQFSDICLRNVSFPQSSLELQSIQTTHKLTHRMLQSHLISQTFSFPNTFILWTIQDIIIVLSRGL